MWVRIWSPGSGYNVQTSYWPPAQSAALPGAQCTALDEFKHVLWGSLNVLCPSSTKIKWMNQTLVLPIPIALSENGIPDKMFPKFISSELGKVSKKKKKSREFSLTHRPPPPPPGNFWVIKGYFDS